MVMKTYVAISTTAPPCHGHDQLGEQIENIFKLQQLITTLTQVPRKIDFLTLLLKIGDSPTGGNWVIFISRPLFQGI